MKLEYQNLCQWGKLKRKLNRKSHNFFYSPNEDDIAGWKLQMFTLEQEAKRESESNLERVKEQANALECPIVVLRDTEVQFIGSNYAVATTDLCDQEWIDRLVEYSDKQGCYASRPFWTHNENDLGNHGYTLYAYGSNHMWARSPQTGFYLVDEDRKVTDRREQIQILWDLGFVARRGRPVGIGPERHCGSREEIALITSQANKLWHRRGHSEVADKICSIYTSINRYYAWPGSW